MKKTTKNQQTVPSHASSVLANARDGRGLEAVTSDKDKRSERAHTNRHISPKRSSNFDFVGIAG